MIEANQVERPVGRLAVMGEPIGPCNYARALLDAADRYGSSAEFACHGSIDAPELIPTGGYRASWQPGSTWGGADAGMLRVTTAPREPNAKLTGIAHERTDDDH